MASFTFHNQTLVIKRLPQVINHTDQITDYDLDNLYPQRIKELSFRSPLTKQAINIQKDFFNGEGFEQNGDLVVNSDGWTINDILNFISDDYSLFLGFSLFFNFNGRGLITEVQFLPFEYVRFGVPDDMLKHKDVKVSVNWEEQSNKTPEGGNRNIMEFSLFNPGLAQGQTLRGGNGQVLYFTGVPDMYPLASLDAVADSTQADAEIQRFELNNAAHGFHGTVIFKTPGDFEDKDEEVVFNRKINNTLGSNSPGLLTVQMDFEEMGQNLFEAIPADNKDKLFETTFKHIGRRIMQNYTIPPALLGTSPEGSVFTTQDIMDSFIYYNNKTKNNRAILARVFNMWGQLWHEGPVEFGDIIEQEFERPVFKQEVVTPVSEEGSGHLDEEERRIEAVIRTTELSNIYGANRYGTG